MLWVLTSLLLAAAIVPWVHQAGKAVAEMILAGDAATFWDEFARSCQRAKFGRYYSRSLIFSAVVLMPLLYWRVQRIRRQTGAGGEVYKPFCVRTALVQLVIAFAIAAGLLWSTGMALELTGAYSLNQNPPGLGKFLKKIIIPTVAVPLVEEWLIRGVLLGLWLRLAKPFAACVGTSLFFAFIHFLDPPSGTTIRDPGSPMAGFELLWKILLHFTEPRFIITDFMTLLAIGMVLSWARLRTGALWFSIGLHAGWIFAFKGFNLIHESVPGHPLRPWGVGESLRSGLVPLLTLAFTALLCHFVMKAFNKNRPDC